MSDDPKARWRDVSQKLLAAASTDAQERVKVQLSLAQDAMKALLLANGGAIVALFTFVGNVLAKTAAVKFDLASLWVAFALFVLGFAFALIAHVVGFISQDRAYYQSAAEVERIVSSLLADEPDFDQTEEIKMQAQFVRFYWIGVGVAVMSLLSFVVGAGFALAGVLV